MFACSVLLALVSQACAGSEDVAPPAGFDDPVTEESEAATPPPAPIRPTPVPSPTPVSTPVVTLVVDPGRYRFLDFVKVGVPLLLLTYLVTYIVAPLVFPF